MAPTGKTQSQAEDFKDMEKNKMRARSFRHEDHNNRRVFLRSYPLQWGSEDEENIEETLKVTEESTEKKPMKKTPIKDIIPSVFHWGEGKVVFLRRFKDKFTIYIIACVPMRFKSPTCLISV